MQLIEQPIFDKPADGQALKFLRFLCWFSILSGVLVIFMTIFSVLVMIVGLSRTELSMTDLPLWKTYLHFFLIALCGVMLAAGGKWCLEAKPLGWHTMSASFLVGSAACGQLAFVAGSAGPGCALVILVPSLLILLPGYVYLFTDRPRQYLNADKAPRLPFFLLHVLLYLLLRLAFSFLQQ